MDRDTLPIPEFTRDELTWLQDVLNTIRADSFDELFEAKCNGLPTEVREREYILAKSVRDKVYHLNGRDTLAPGNHLQRFWDQRHDY